MAAMNKSLARNNKSQTGGKARLPSEDGSALLLLPLRTLHRLKGGRPWPVLPTRGRTGMNPSHHGSGEQVFGVSSDLPIRGRPG